MKGETKSYYYIQYKSSNGMWHYHPAKIPFPTEAAARAKILELSTKNSLEHTPAYRVVWLIEIVTPLDDKE